MCRLKWEELTQLDLELEEVDQLDLEVEGVDHQLDTEDDFNTVGERGSNDVSYATPPFSLYPTKIPPTKARKGGPP